MARRDQLIRQAFRDRFVVTMRSKETFEGLLLDADDRTVVLADAYALTGRDRVSVDGSLYLPRAEVAYMQRPEVRG